MGLNQITGAHGALMLSGWWTADLLSGHRPLTLQLCTSCCWAAAFLLDMAAFWAAAMACVAAAAACLAATWRGK